MPSSPLLLLQSGVWEGPSRLPLLISQASLLCLQDQCGEEGGEGGFLEGRGPAWELSRLPSPSGPGDCPPLLSHSSRGPSPLPLLISHAAGAPILSGLYFSYPLSPPTSYQLTLGFLPSPWGSEPPPSGRHPSCGKTLTLCLPTLPS